MVYDGRPLMAAYEGGCLGREGGYWYFKNIYEYFKY